MDFNNKDEIRLIHKHLDMDTVAKYGISLAWVETIRKYIEHLEHKNQTIKADTVSEMKSEIQERCIDAGIYPAFVARTIDRVAEDIIEK